MEKKEYVKLPLNKEGKLIINKFALKSPKNLVFISQKKTGKTLTAANKNKILIGDCEGGTQDFGFPVNNQINLTKYEGEEEFKLTTKYGYIPMGLYQTVSELKHANNMSEYWALYSEFDKNKSELNYNNLIECINKMPFPIFMIDTITSFIELSNAAALYEYNKSVKPESRKKSVKLIDDFGGVRVIRRKFDEIKLFLEQNASPFIIYAGHIAERKKIFKKSEEDLSTVDIDLEGVMSKIFTVKASAIGIFQRNNEGCFLDFTKRDESDLGVRNAHLSNRIIKIADFIDSTELMKGKSPKTYWNEIYPEIKEI